MFYKISEVSKMLDLNSSMLRFWEKEFVVLKPQKNSKGERIYTQSDLATIKRIRFLLKEKGFTIPGAIQTLENVKNLDKEIGIIEKLEEIKTFLESVKNKL